MKAKHIVGLAVLALMMSACSSDEKVQCPSSLAGTALPFTATISAGNASTRSLAENGNTIAAAWEEEEQVGLVHGKTVDVLAVKSVDKTSGTATISGTISHADNGESVMVVYLGKSNDPMSQFVTRINSKLEEDASLSTISEALVKEVMDTILLETVQEGTLDGISMKADQRLGSGCLTVVGESASLDGTVTVKEQNAIWKLTLTDGTDALKAEQLVIKGGEEDDGIIIDQKEATDVFYVVMKPVANKTLTIMATMSDTSVMEKATVTLEAGKFYRSTFTFSIPVPQKEEGEIAFAKDADTQTLSATASENTYTQVVTKTGDAVPTYSLSDNTCGAEINASTGVVTFTKAGSVKVTATVEDTDAYTYATKSVSYTLTVVAPVNTVGQGGGYGNGGEIK